MVKVNDDYFIEIDSLNYTVKRDEHKTREEKIKGSDEVKIVPVCTIIGYYGDLATAILGAIKDMNRRELGSGTHTLQEAVDVVLKNNRYVTELLDKVAKEARYNAD